MKVLTKAGAVCVLAAPLLALVAAPASTTASVQTVTFTFKLTINGTPARTDSFAVTWGETGLALCNAPCAGGGHSYTQAMTFPTGVTETFLVVRATPPVTPGHPGQVFLRQTLTANRDTTLSAVFTYGPTSVSTPTTGFVPPMVGAVVAGSGALLLTLLLLSVRLRGDRDELRASADAFEP